MEEVKVEVKDNQINICLSGNIDSSNAEEIKSDIFAQIGDASGKVVIDASELKYISSAGLRILLQLRKRHSDMSIIEVSPEIYEILDVTGFTQMMNVTRAFNRISIDDCKIIGRGANGTVYRLDNDNVVKIYHDADALDDIQQEREVAKLALILGIPTAISYDIVRVGNQYGSVFELLNAESFAQIIAEDPSRLDWCVKEYVDLLHLIHSTEAPEGKLPDMKDTAMDWARFTKDYLPADAGDKLVRLIDDIPRTNHIIHGDYHAKNIMLAGDEVLLIDLDTLSVGDPVYEFGSIYNALEGFSEVDHNVVLEFMGIDRETATVFFNKVMAAYAGTDDKAVIDSLVDRARIIGYTRLIRRSIRRQGLEIPERKVEIDLWTEELIELLGRVDKLSYVS